MAKTPINNAGSRAGRGFRYQDAVGVLLAVQAWAGLSQHGRVIPEANDDFDLSGASEVEFAQVKSRRKQAGLFNPGDVAAFVSELWDRHDAAAASPSGLLLILERSIKGESGLATPQSLPASVVATPRLREDRRSATLAHKTRVIVVPSPMDDAIGLIAATLECTPAEASIYYGEVLQRVGQASDENGVREPEARASIGKTDVTSLIDGMRALVALGDMDAALQAGLCESVDFVTPISDERFYLGIDVEPGHLAAGLVIERPEARQLVIEGLEAQGSGLVVGPSGAGKSALMWDAASATRHVVRWYRVRSLSETQVPMLARFARALRASAAAPVGFVFDNVGADFRSAWDALSRLTTPGSGTVLLGSIREEDVFLVETRSRTVEIRVGADDAFAQRLWSELHERGQTHWAGWREPWEMAKGLLLEFAHILTQGERLAAVLTDQIDRRQREGRHLELSALRVASFAGASSALVDSQKLAEQLDVSQAELSEALRRLVDEHLVTVGSDGLVGGMHQLRSAQILELTHRTPPPPISKTIAQAIPTVPIADLEGLVANAELPAGGTGILLEALASRLARETNPVSAAVVFRGLGERHIRETLHQWIPTVLARGVPPTQVSTAVMFAVSNVELIDLPQLAQINAAALDLRAAQRDDPRVALLERVSEPTLQDLASSAPEALEGILAGLVGAEAGPLLERLRSTSVDLARLDLDLAVQLLGTMALHDGSLASKLVQDAGQDTLLNRLHAETPWTSNFTVAEEAAGRVVYGEVRLAAPSVQTDVHSEVVALCEKLLALVPDAEIAAVRAVSPDGQLAGLAGFPLADKRLVRSAAPAEALPGWNRRWLSATAGLLGSESYTSFLERGYTALRLVVPALEQVIDARLRGKAAPRAIDRLAEAYEIARDLTSPAAGHVERSVSAGQTGAYVSDLQSVIHDTATELPRRFINAGDAHGMFSAWTNTLAEQIDKVRDEPWDLIGADPTPLLDRLSDLIGRLQVLVGEAAARGGDASALWRADAKNARIGNALRLVFHQAELGVRPRFEALKSEMEGRLQALGLRGHVHTLRTNDASVEWPPAEILVVLEIDALGEWTPSVGEHWEALRDAIGEGRKLVLVPRLGGIVIGGLAIQGSGLALPSPGTFDEKLRGLSYELLDEVCTRELRVLLDAIFEADAMRQYGYGESNRPQVEQEALARAEGNRTRSLEFLVRAAESEIPNFAELLGEFLRLVDTGEIRFAQELSATIRGADTNVGRQVARLQQMMLSLDLIQQTQHQNG